MPTNGQFAVGELVTASDANTSFTRGNQNFIANGDFAINQRNFTSTTTTGTYGFDRWRISNAGGTVTYSAQNFALGNTISGYEPTSYARIVTSGQSGSSDLAILSQPIESVRTLAGQQVAISFWARANTGTPKIAVELVQYFGTGGSPSSAANTYAGQITLSTSWARHILIVTLPSISGKTIGTNSNDTLDLNFWISAGSSFNTRTGSLGLQANTFEIWGAQVEQGALASPFQVPIRASELARCQRYYWRITTSGQFRFPFQGNRTSSTQAYGSVAHPVPMRAVPTVIDFNNVGITDSITYTSTAGTWAFEGSFSNAYSSAVLIFSSSGVNASGNALVLLSSGSFFGIGAEY